MKNFKVDESGQSQRADIFLVAKFPQFTRSSLGGLFTNGLVTIAKKAIKPSYKVKINDILVVNDLTLNKEIPTIEIPIIFENKDVVVVNKPEKILTHSKGAITDEASVATFIRPKLGKDFPVNNRAGIVHRLDRATSGVLITAKSKTAQDYLQKQFSLRKVKKKYIAVVNGHPQESEAIIDVAIERNPNRPQTFRASSNGKPAKTQYKVLKSVITDGKEYSVVELNPETGRTHQIRIHMDYIGTPVLGDFLYAKQDLEHMFLHSLELEITIPGGNRMIFEAPLPEYFNHYIR